MSPTPQKEHVAEVEAELIRETPGGGGAYLIDDGLQQVWVPKSLVEHTDDGFFVMPEWLAIREGLI